MRLSSAAAVVLLALAPVGAAQAQADDITNKIVNDPGSPQVTGAKASLRDDAKVQGGKALRVDVPRKGANVWDSSVGSAIKKPVKAGDQIVLVFSARLAKTETGAATATLPFAAVQLAAAPYTPLFNQSVEIGPEWKMIEVRGKADRNYPAGALNATVHLATAKQSVEFGPIVVLDLGAQ